MRVKNWTSGPWHMEPVTDEDGQQFWSDDWNGKVFCVCHPRTECDATTVVPWINKSDAQLISAAPELVEALEGLLEMWSERHVREAQAALAKAYGETV